VTTVRHIAHAVGSIDTSTPPYRVRLQVGRHQLAADEPPAKGGQDSSPSPFGLLLGALAACTTNTLRMYADRKGWEVLPITVDVRYDVGDDGQAAIARSITLPVDVTMEQQRRLDDIASRTPVTLALRTGTPINTTFQVAPTRPPS
jgi:putative redox protein